ncbi:glycosyltransferase family 4 protein [Brucella intermedia]|jgi:glycosyltransferase involved in cell wall biosynthesis|uniref:Group 1 glycosyl transferase n=1 Tax=Ochrobactrum sp. PW1 TaxID=1882222 RepID=A0A292GRL3_9HYPH|nr:MULTISPECIES: glycosyltransferase family 4 protein [Brucella]MBM7331130.1 glycosyltransferase family 4 protein [Agrobacterium sp. S2]MCH6202741.1 glycosyltransferase family 4 protein [Brucella ciceri]BBA73431.1 group 1 glycosyl transferase [Ochrobactrum sp. PW1]
MEGSVVVSQLGARRHYAVPRIFANNQRLAHFYTDICAFQGWPRLLGNVPPNALPSSVRRLVGRKPQGIPLKQMTTFPVFGLHSAIRRLANQTGPKSTANAIWAGETFGRLVAESGFHGAGGVYAFSGEAVEVLSAARKAGLWTAVDQVIAPRAIVDRLGQEEELLNPGWQLPVEDDGYCEAFAERERTEWQLADLVVCPSPFVARHVAEEGCAPEKIVVVPTGVDTRFQIERKARAPGKLRVLTVGAVGLRKGSPYVGAVSKLLAEQAEFRMVGPLELLPDAQAKLAATVELTGPIPRSEMRKQFEWADAFLLPSLCEGSAISVYEALAAGLPVICTENTGSVVRNGVDGYIVPIRDVRETSEILRELAGNPAALERMGENARERAADYTLSRYGERLAAAIFGERAA